MSRPLAATSMTATLSIFLLLPLLSAVTCTYSGNLDSDFFRDLPLSSSRHEQEAPNRDKSQRLLDLLELKASMNDLLSHDLDSDQQEDKMDTLDDLQPSAAKRVFCNSFTGCGGRFRGRRRQEPASPREPQRTPFWYPKRLFAKKPFCNNSGCANFGKKRSLPVAGDLPKLPVLDMASQKVLGVNDGWSESRLIKRVFCNSYGGCKHGKRAAPLDKVESGHADSKENLLDLSDGLDDSTMDKRFMASDFDKDMTSLIDSMKR